MWEPSSITRSARSCVTEGTPELISITTVPGFMPAAIVSSPPTRTFSTMELVGNMVITTLPTSSIVENVLVGGDDTIAAGMKPGTVVIEMSSGVPSVTQLLAERVMELGSHMIY